MQIYKKMWECVTFMEKMYYLCKQNHLKDTIMNIGDMVPEILGSEVKK